MRHTLGLVSIAAALTTASCGGSTIDSTASTGPAGTGPVVTSIGGVPADWTVGRVLSTSSAPCTGTLSGAATTYLPTLVVIDARTGRLRWQSCPAHPESGLFTVIVDDVVVYSASVLSESNEFYTGVAGFDLASGKQLWQFVSRDFPAAPGGRSLYVPSTHHESGVSAGIVAIDARTGRERWRNKDLALGWAQAGYRAVPQPQDDGRVLVVRDATSLIGLDATTGREAWRAPVNQLDFVQADGSFVVVTAIQDPPAATTVVIDTRTGAEVWRQPGSPVLVRETVTIVVDDPVAGQETPTTTSAALPSDPTGAPPPQSPPSDVRMTARATATGEVLWSRPATNGPLFTEDVNPQQRADRGSIVVTHDGGGVAGTDPATGAIVWRRTDLNRLDLVGRDLAVIDTDVIDMHTGRDVASTADALPCRRATDACTLASGYVQARSLRGTTLALALNDFSGA